MAGCSKIIIILFINFWHMLTSKTKKKVIEKHQIHGKDTGSPEVQIAVLTEQIKKLVNHLKKNPKDNLSRRGLLKMVSKRRALLNYLQKESEKRYESLTKKVGLKAKKSSFVKTSKDKK